MFNDLAYIKQAFEMIFKSLRYTGYRTDAITGKLDSSGNLIADATQGLPANYIWVRLGDDRTAVPMLSKIRAVAGVDVVTAYDRLWREDVVLEVNLPRTPLNYAAAYNVPLLPTNMSTPVSARDIVPGGVFADINGGLYVRVGAYWHEATFWDDSAPLALTPTATSSQKSMAIVGMNRATNTLTFTLTDDRSLAINLIIDGAPTSYAITDILAVMEADRAIDWRGAVELANGATEIDPAKIISLNWRKAEMGGADGSDAGVSGLVPTPASADNVKYLRGDGTWAAVSSSALPAFGAGVTKTLSSDVASAGSDRHLVIAAQSGTADNLIEITGLSAGDETVIRADAGDTITVKHNDAGATDKILLHAAADLALSGDMTLKLIKTASGKVVQYVDASGSGGGLTHTYVGYNTAGGSNTAMLGGTAYMKKITLASAGWLGSIGVYIDHTASTNVQSLSAWVLSDNAGTPNLIIAVGPYLPNPSFFINTTARWVDIAIGTHLPAGDYWLVVQRPVDSGTDLRIYYDGSGSDKTQAIGNAWNADGSLYTISDTTNKYSIRGSILT